MSLAEVVALAILAALTGYTLFGGADFGGGVWDLLATGPRAPAQRRLIEKAIAPVWEANHVWLIIAVVILFSGFPPAFAAIGIALHIPLTITLLGIVFRGSAFVFRQYGGGGRTAERWRRVFAIASTVTPIFLGVCLGAITEGIPLDERLAPVDGFFGAWLRPFPFACGALTLVLFSFLAASYLTVEARDDVALRDDFRRRALGALAALVVTAALCALVVPPNTRFQDRLLQSGWSIVVVGGAVCAAIATALLLYRRRFALARAGAGALASFLVVGWGLSQAPYLIAPDITIAGAAAPRATLVLLLVILAFGGAITLPALYYLIKVFKMRS